MDSLKNKGRELIESTSVAIVMLVIFLPVRILFVKYISNDWFGSFGLITLVSVIILILAMKNKLGWFGKAYHRQLYKANRGKRQYFFYFNLSLTIAFFTISVYAINIGQTDEVFVNDVKEVKNVLPYDDLEGLSKEPQLKIEDLPKSIMIFFYIIFIRFDIFIILITVMNDLTNGWYLHFSTVFLVEALEVLGLLIFYRIVIKKDPEHDIST